VGTELPFERLISAVDEWAQRSGRSGEVLAQIGRSNQPPANLRWRRFLDGPEFNEVFCNAKLIVAHAGMGTILTALQHERPLIVMPRRASLAEHRNDHQLATATRLSELGRVIVAFDEDDLISQLDHQKVTPLEPIGPSAAPGLLGAISEALVRFAGEGLKP
jgi:UDP-N-acetylglucosamine transferase subunit ALG13